MNHCFLRTSFYLTLAQLLYLYSRSTSLFRLNCRSSSKRIFKFIKIFKLCTLLIIIYWRANYFSKKRKKKRERERIRETMRRGSKMKRGREKCTPTDKVDTFKMSIHKRLCWVKIIWRTIVDFCVGLLESVIKKLYFHAPRRLITCTYYLYLNYSLSLSLSPAYLWLPGCFRWHDWLFWNNKVRKENALYQSATFALNWIHLCININIPQIRPA